MSTLEAIVVSVAVGCVINLFSCVIDERTLLIICNGDRLLYASRTCCERCPDLNSSRIYL